MRPITKIKNEVLTVREWEATGEHFKKILLMSVLSELGYDVTGFHKFQYSSKELTDRALAEIRNNKLEIKRLRAEHKKLAKKIQDSFFEFAYALAKLRYTI